MTITLYDVSFFVLYVFSVGYAVKILMIDHPGPFADVSEFKDDSSMPVKGVTDGEYLYPIDLFHRIKFWLGVYHVNEAGYWEPQSTVLWSCPWCLSFWVNLLGVSGLYALDIFPPEHLALMVFAVPFCVGFLYSIMDE